MSQLDFIGGAQEQPARPFKDIRNTRSTIAEEKAALCLELGRLCLRVPPSVANGSIEMTRNWVGAQKTSMKLVKSSRASVQELTSAIGNMRRFLGPT
jgi:hypothetical protein